MKHKWLFLLAVCTIITGCSKESSSDESAAFLDISWTRDSGHDIETIRFLDNGEFRYSCACGNPVNDSDVCESYDYDPETKLITLNCFEEIEGMVTSIKVISCDETTLVLDFDGDIRTFTRE